MGEKTVFHLLLVEDNPGDADLANESLLDVPGYEFALVCVSSLVKALQLLETTHFDGILLDLSLPDSNGVETLKRVRSVRDDLPIVVLTGLGANHLQRAVIKAGALDFIGKNEPRHQLLGRSIVYNLERYYARKQQSDLHKLVSANPDAVLVVDNQGIVQFVNEAATNLFGKKKEDFIGELLGFSVKEGVFSEIEIWRHGELRNGEMQVVALEWNKKPALLASVRDITEQKKLTERVQQAQKMEAIGQLAGGIAHDFNNILTAIVGNLKIAQMDLPSDHSVQICLAEVARAAERAGEIVKQILTVTHNRTAEHKKLAVEPMVKESLRFLRAVIPAQIAIGEHFQPNLPAIVADATQFHQVLMNLGVNAAHAMQEQGGQLDVYLEAVTLNDDKSSQALGLQVGPYIRLTVRDNGCGMERSVAERIFEPFFTTKPQGQGNGLGLSVVHGIMKSHNGAVTVYSEPGKGTVFNLYFPSLETKARSEQQAPSAEPVAAKNERILLVDDEKALVFLSKRVLERAGYQVAGYYQAEDAIAAFRAEPQKFDLVITDMSMPVIDGPELVRRVRAVRDDIPVVVVTGYLRPQDEELLRQLKVQEVVLKPTSVEHLAAVSHRWIAEARANDFSAA